jgi:uncharacterized RDD family membrane protein YckC
MENTPLHGIDFAAAKKRNIRIAIGIGAAGFVGFIALYAAMFLLMFLSPGTLFRLMPMPDIQKDAVEFQGKLYVFSEGIDFRNATWEQEPREITTMREVEAEELSEAEEIEPFSSLAAGADAIYFFYEGGYRTFDGRSWKDFKNSDIGSRPQGAVNAGRIWVLSEIEDELVLVRIDGGVVMPVELPFESESSPDIHKLDIVPLGGTLNLFERRAEGLKHYVYSLDEWRGPELIEDVHNCRFLTQGGRLWLYSKQLNGPLSERSFDGTFWSDARPLSFGTGLMGMFYHPVRYGSRRALVLNNFFRNRVYVLNNDGTASEKYSFGGIMTPDFVLAMVLWSIVSFAVMILLVFVLSVIVSRYKLRRWPAADGRTYEFASFFRRFLAHLIDMLILLVPVYAAVFFLLVKLFSSPDPFRLIVIFMTLMVLGVIVVPFLYYSLFEGLGGKTPGKVICGIRVLKEDFSRCGIGAAMLRTLLRVVDAFFYYLVGMVSIGATLRWQRLGDLAASTVVVRDRKSSTPARSPRGGGLRRP